MNTGFRYETVSETERGKTCLDRLTGDTVEFVREGMYSRKPTGRRGKNRIPAIVKSVNVNPVKKEKLNVP